MSISPAHFITSSLQKSPKCSSITSILAAALNAVDPTSTVKRCLSRKGTTLYISNQSLSLDLIRLVYVVGFGKAAYPMALATIEILGEYFTKGIIITKDGYAPQHSSAGHISNLTIFEASHPLPDLRGVKATQELVHLLKTVTENDLILCLISGGGSALLTAPAPGITLEEMQQTTTILLASGASINEFNTLRKHLDMVKGGRLAYIASPAHIITLILSDVVGDPLDIIASGPTYPDPTTINQALEVVEKYELASKLPPSIMDQLHSGFETPKPGDPIFQNTMTEIIGSNYLACQSALEQAKREGFNTLLLTTYLQGEARDAGGFLASVIRQVCLTGEPIPPPACIIIGGETTVTLHGQGSGGRNQELALGAVKGMAHLNNAILITLATDGGDGPTNAAGAVVTGDTLHRADDLGLNPDHFLAKNDSYHFFAPLGDLIITGPTQTNVNDLAFLFIY